MPNLSFPIEKGEKIALNFRYNNKCYTEYFYMNDKFQYIIYKITSKLKLNGTEKFIFNAKTVHPNLSLAEAGMTNNANIFITPSRGINGNSKQKSNDSDSESSSEEKEKSKQLSCVNYITVNFRNISQNGNLPILSDENISIGRALKNYLERELKS